MTYNELKPKLLITRPVNSASDFASFFEKELELDISQDEDVFLHLFKFTTGLGFKNYNYKN